MPRKPTFAIYVQPLRGRPKRVDLRAAPWAPEIEYEGSTYYFSTCDAVRRYVTYTAMKPVAP